MPITDCKDIAGPEARCIAECVEAGNGIVKPAPPRKVECCALDRGDTHAVQVNEFGGVKPHVIRAEPARTSGIRPDQLDRQIVVHPFRAV